ncbi:MAG: glutaredoxin family protein [Chloroflexi bacterium]|nr:glutaredoxin family protein [Chloroflexota bacterium]
MKTQIEIFTQPTCVDCQTAKAYFQQRGIEYVEHNIEDPESFHELHTRVNRVATPTIFIADRVFFGFANNREEIEIALTEMMK